MAASGKGEGVGRVEVRQERADEFGQAAGDVLVARDHLGRRVDLSVQQHAVSELGPWVPGLGHRMAACGLLAHLYVVYLVPACVGPQVVGDRSHLLAHLLERAVVDGADVA